jgi:enamine deaminase RidA (YjgF/YER057c/UK114 family)
MTRREYLAGDARQRGRAYSPAVKIHGGTTLYMAGQTGYQDELRPIRAISTDKCASLSTACAKPSKPPAAGWMISSR